jgi:hypothetical protein
MNQTLYAHMNNKRKKNKVLMNMKLSSCMAPEKC